jgi:hypothetical protein
MKSIKFTNREKLLLHITNLVIGFFIFYLMGLLTISGSFLLLVTVLLSTELGFFLLQKNKKMNQ